MPAAVPGLVRAWSVPEVGYRRWNAFGGHRPQTVPAMLGALLNTPTCAWVAWLSGPPVNWETAWKRQFPQVRPCRGGAGPDNYERSKGAGEWPSQIWRDACSG
ncbi:hypothetical protein GCM10009560_47570 [Nonomuraea longicatena]|uniref:Transposase n=1 Tax=Nonomuraea longicatena TaxID=83682 RepID=A0ABP4AM15_9ACTN